ncbi:hypothetical protein LTS18_010738, partial [Coniosporium uncinatum]
RKPPTTNAFNAPTHPLSPSLPLFSFQSARLSVRAKWTTQYDQGGLLLHLTSSSDRNAPDKWLKTGVEYYNGRPYLSTVCCDQYADWSIYPLPSTYNSETDWVTLEARREGDVNGVGLWVYHIVGGEERVPLREVAWFFAGEGEWGVQVRGMAARPARRDAVKGAEGEGDGGLDVEIGGWEVATV